MFSPLDRRLEHYRKALLIQSGKTEKWSSLSELNRLARDCIAQGNVEESKYFLRSILEIDRHYQRWGFDREMALSQLLYTSIKLVCNLTKYKFEGLKVSGWQDRKENSRSIENWIDYYKERVKRSYNSPLDAAMLGHLLTDRGRLQEAETYYGIANYQKNKNKYKIKGYTSLEYLKQSSPRQEPNFIVIGVIKGGSTSLYQYINQHPQCLSAIDKEVQFFNTSRFQDGVDWYKWQFPLIPEGSSLISGEATPLYYAGYEVEKKIQSLFPNVRLIIVLRNPIKRAFSHYEMLKIKGFENRSWIESFFSELEHLNDLSSLYYPAPNYWKSEKGYLLFSLYFYFLEKWLTCFPKEQFLILSSEDLFANPEVTLDRVFKFLGLPNYSLPEYPHYNPGLYKSMDDEIYQKLADFFRPHNQKLEERLGMKFNWD